MAFQVEELSLQLVTALVPLIHPLVPGAQRLN